ncbi:MAG: cysteine-rich CWC family protein [Pseudomonadota bacterium]
MRRRSGRSWTPWGTRTWKKQTTRFTACSCRAERTSLAASDSHPNVDLQDTSRCPACGTGLRCGRVAGDSHCWCFSMPHVIAVPDGKADEAASQASCLCPACLQRLIDGKHSTTSTTTKQPGQP